MPSVILNPASIPNFASQLLQQNLDETFLLCTVSWKLVTLASELVELAISLETLYFEIWVAAMIDNVEQVDKYGFQSLTEVSDDLAMAYSLCSYDRRTF